MPVGRFREDPRTLGDREREIYARQYPEGLLVVGTLLGTVLRLAIDAGVVPVPLALAGHAISVGGVLIGGVGGYLLGVAYRQRKLEAIDGRASRGSDHAVGDDEEGDTPTAETAAEASRPASPTTEPRFLTDDESGRSE